MILYVIYSPSSSISYSFLRHQCFFYEDDDGDGYTEEAGDCDDADATISPAATEVEDTGIDEDCDGLEDDGSIIPPSDTTPPETDPDEGVSGSSGGCGCDLYGNRSINSSQLVMLGMFLMGIGMILIIRRLYVIDYSKPRTY